MTQQARPAMAADWHALVAVIERSQIVLSRPATRVLIPYKDEVDIAVLEWIASHVCGVRQFTRWVM
jgi:hypothetical protein